MIGKGANVDFDAHALATYFFAEWDPLLFDALLVAGAVEFCDRTFIRPSTGWARYFVLRIPVHDPDHWNGEPILKALRNTLSLLTGDSWVIDFVARRHPEPSPPRDLLPLSMEMQAVIPFSDGIDSRAVAGLVERCMPGRLVRVRLGNRRSRFENRVLRQHFAAVPYKVKPTKRFREPSGRSRGFKFATVSAIAAKLSGARTIIIPESGQGALGPSLVTVGEIHPDYRNHPLFARKMESYCRALLGDSPEFLFPRLWHTKGETLSKFVATCPEYADSLLSTWSCWQPNWLVSVNGKKRQCGICAACLLRRMSIHAAGLAESAETYVWEDLSAPTFPAGAAAGFDRKKITTSMQEYSIGGALHLDHLSALRFSLPDAAAFDLNISQIAFACGISHEEAKIRLWRLLDQHQREWRSFMEAVGPSSFLKNITVHS